ncbi:MAG: hypothetical protein ACLP4R_01045 [Solirubrobacteraceae bacterium]
MNPSGAQAAAGRSAGVWPATGSPPRSGADSTRELHGTTVLVVSHDVAVAQRADRVVHLVDGRIV